MLLLLFDALVIMLYVIILLGYSEAPLHKWTIRCNCSLSLFNKHFESGWILSHKTQVWKKGN